MTIVDVHWPRADVWLAQDDPDPQLVVVGVPSSRSSLTDSRADLTPLELRNRLGRFSTFHGELNVDFGPVRVRDLGNWPMSEVSADALPDQIGLWASELPRSDLHLFLGGDNAITRPLVAARSDSLEEVGLITFDAHHDVRSLAGGPSNGNPIRGLIEEHGLPGQNVVQIGIHSFANSAAYRAYCENVGITTVTVEQVEKVGMKTVVDVALSQLSATCEEIFVDVDLDVLDQVFAPGCHGARPGGLGIRELASGVARCASHHTVSSMDFVEVDPTEDINHVTIDAAAHLLLSAVAGYTTRLATEAR